MAKKSRKRRHRPPAAPPPKRSEAQPAREAPVKEEPPPAPWGSFPLVELCVLLALVLFAAGLFTQGRQGLAMLGAGLALGSLAGLELSIREHLAGYRSHTVLLAGGVTVLALAVIFFLAPAGFPPILRLALAAAVFGAAFWAFRGVFRRRSGGLAFRVGGLRG